MFQVIRNRPHNATPPPRRRPMRCGRIGVRVALFTLSVLTAGLSLSASPALAVGHHAFAKSLEAPPAGFHSPYGLAVGPAGEVFVINSATSTMDVYGSTDKFEQEFPVEVGASSGAEIAVDDSTEAADPSRGDVYIGTYEGKVLKYEYDALTKTATKAASITGLTCPAAVAVDSHGDVYTADICTGDVNKYGPTGTLITENLMTGLAEPESLAVNNDPGSPAYEDVFVGSAAGVREYNPSGACLNGCAGFGGVTSHTVGLTVGPEGYVYVDQPGGAEETSVFEPDGALVESFDPAHLIHEGYGIGVSGTTVFIATGGGEEVAEFTPAVPKYPLTVKKTGSGRGSVTSEQQPGINCGGECTHEFPEGETVKLKETPAPGSTFTKWEGCAAESSGVCEVTMSATTEVKAEYAANSPVGFAPTYAGSGTGEVKCEVNKEGGFVACASEYGEGTELVLEGTAAAGSTFEGWSAGTGSASSCSGTGTCAFTIAKATTITATFNRATTSPLTVYVTGNGKVDSNPAGIAECRSMTGTCEAKFKGPVTLTATPETGYVLAGWLGCKKTTETACEVNVTTATEVTAVFLKEGEKGTEGPPGPKGEKGQEGKEGEEGFEGRAGAPGAKGAPGEKGATGANGVTGGAGVQGPPGPAGPTGPTGKEGPTGKVELVTCKKAGKKQRCTTKLVAGTVAFTTTGAVAQATLSRRGAVYAAGTARNIHGRLSLRLLPVRRLGPGEYTLTLISGSARHETIQSEPFTLMRPRETSRRQRP